jgi:mitochondrial cardiolipin hydrolase
MRAAAASLVLVLLAVPLKASQVLFSSHDNIEGLLLALIRRADTSIDAAVYDLSSPRLRRALREAAQRGVTVRIVVDRFQFSRKSPRNDPFLPALEVRVAAGRSRRGAMHHKFAVFDGAEVVTGSYNWTPGAQHINYENVIVDEDPATTYAFRRQFEEIWGRSRTRGLAPDRAKDAFFRR